MCGAPAFAVELDPNARAKAVAAAGVAPQSATAAIASHSSIPDFVNGIDADGRTFNGACSVTRSDVCYDYREGRLIYRPARNWMPEFSGLTPESISVRRDKVTFTYSFK